MIQRRLVKLAEDADDKDAREAPEDAEKALWAREQAIRKPKMHLADGQLSAEAAARNSRSEKPSSPLMDPLSSACAITGIAAEPLENFLCQLLLACC